MDQRSAALAKFRFRLTRYRNAYNRLRDVVNRDLTDDLERDGFIQRFEFVAEQAWKLLREALRLEGVDAATPMAVLREACKARLVQDETDFDRWRLLLEDRNRTSHEYSIDEALALVARIREAHFSLFERLLTSMEALDES